MSVRPEVLVLEDCGRCGEVATRVDADAADQWERTRAMYQATGWIIPAKIRWHVCPNQRPPVKPLRWWERLMLRVTA